jgi:hypothetical protein
MEGRLEVAGVGGAAAPPFFSDLPF